MMRNSRRWLSIVLPAAVLGAVVLLPTACRTTATRDQVRARLDQRVTPAELPRPVRAVWVARFHYRYAGDIATIMENCARLGCNTVLWQVRGEGTVAYPSAIEPWSREFGFKDPGFDPLAVAVAEAHRNGLRIDAWVNVMPGWKGKQPPPEHIGQLHHTHPEWFLHDAAGHRQPAGTFYQILNPCLPEVRDHIANVMDEIVTHYDVDGIHLDYVRYAWDGLEGAKDNYPRDPRTLSLYRQATGKAPDDDRRAWNHWRANQLTRLVGQIRHRITHRRPGVALTASVWRNPQRGYQDYLQNSVAWLRTGLIDAAMPMAYTTDAHQFEDDIHTYRSLAPNGHVVPGIGLYLHKREDQTAVQMQQCRQWGGDFALFSYESLHATHGDRNRKPADRRAPNAARAMHRAAIGAG